MTRTTLSRPAIFELLDEVQMDALIRYAKLDYPKQPALFFEFHGTEAGVKEQAEMVAALGEEYSIGGFRWTQKAEERSKLWEARHNVLYSCLALRPGAKALATDACVPISRLADCILETRKDIDEHGLLAPIVGHVGEGNFHVTVVLDPESKDEMKTVEGFVERLALRAIAMGGTCTGEHGIGYGKIPFLQAEHGEGVAVMRQLKAALDPENRMNPGKIFAA